MLFAIRFKIKLLQNQNQRKQHVKKSKILCFRVIKLKKLRLNLLRSRVN